MTEISDAVGRERKRLQQTGLKRATAKYAAWRIVLDKLPEAEAVRLATAEEAERMKTAGPAQMPADPNSKTSKKKAGQRRDLEFFKEAVGDLPDDLSLLKWIRSHGRQVFERALEKAADIEELETSEEVLTAAKVIVEGWKKRGWL